MAVDALLKKLQHRAGTPVLVLWAPAELEPVIGGWEDDGVTVHRRMRGGAPFVLAFVRSCAEIERSAARLASLLGGDDPLLWMAYPKKASKNHRSDIGRDDAWQPLGDLGFEPVRQVAVDAEWSALRFRRTEKVAKLTGLRALSPAGRDRLASADEEAVAAWLDGLAEPRRSALRTLHRLICDAAPQLAPARAGGSIAYVSVESRTHRLLLRGNARAVTLSAPGAGPGTGLRFRTGDDLDLDSLRDLIRDAMLTR